MSSFERFVREQDKIIREDKEKTLISLGITEREYAPEGRSGWPYEKYEYDRTNGQKRYYKEVAANVTDEEYAIIIEKAQKVAAIKKKDELSSLSEVVTDPQEFVTSKVATVLRLVAGIIAVIAVIIALVLFGDRDTALTGGIVLLGAIVEAALFCALAEILDRLTEISYYTGKIRRNTTK